MFIGIGLTFSDDTLVLSGGVNDNSSTPPPPGSKILLEDGFAMLAEDGSYLILE